MGTEGVNAPRELAGDGAARGRAPETEREPAQGLDAQPVVSPVAGAAGLLRLQRAAGNASVAGLLQREAAVAANEAPVQKAARTLDYEDVKAVWSDADSQEDAAAQYARVGADTRAKFVEKLLAAPGWVGPRDRRAILAVWQSFGAGLPAFVQAHGELWKRSEDAGVELGDLPGLAELRHEFGRDVKSIAWEYMEKNYAFANEEAQKLGLERGKGGEQADPAAAAKRTQEVQLAAQYAKRAQTGLDKLRQTPVGWKTTYTRDFERRQQVMFDPTKRPEEPPGQHDASMVRWEDAKEAWDKLNAVLGWAGARSPAVYAGIAQDRVGDLAEGSPEHAQQAAKEVLDKLRENIRLSKIMLGNPGGDSIGELDWRDLEPIHRQMFEQGKKADRGGVDWSASPYREIGKKVLADHKSAEFWKTLGLSTAAAAAFLLAELATGGLATAVLLGAGMTISAGQAVESWDNWDKLRTAAGTSASRDTETVSTGQADAALVDAVLNTAFALIDIGGPLVSTGREAIAAAKLAGTVAERSGLKALESLASIGSVAERTQVVERAIAEVGVDETLKRSGKKSVEELLATIDRDSDAAKRLLEASRVAGEGAATDGARLADALGIVGAEREWLAAGKLEERLGALVEAVEAKKLSKEAADKIVHAAIEQLGPVQAVQRAGGWKALSKAVPIADGATAKRLLAWREAVWKDLEDYVAKDLKGEVVRTGTVKDLSNDIDMSFKGANATATKVRAQEYLTAKLGVENDPRVLDELLMAGLFTDPRRMHAWDVLAPELREEVAKKAAAREEQLIWNRRLFDAREAGDAAMEKSIRESMEKQGVAVVEGYHPLSPDAVERLAAEIDKLHGELDTAMKAGDEAAKRRLVEEIGEKQALINATEGGGYFSGGGVRRYVSGRDEPSKVAFPDLKTGVGSPLAADAEHLTAIIDQWPKLDHARESLLHAASPKELADGIRGVGKYAERLSTTMKEAAGAGGAEWEALAKQFEGIKAEGKSFLELGAEQQADLLRRTTSMLDDITARSESFVKALRESSGLKDVPGGLEALQKATDNHVLLLQASDALAASASSFFGGAAKTAMSARDAVSGAAADPDAPAPAFPAGY